MEYLKNTCRVCGVVAKDGLIKLDDKQIQKLNNIGDGFEIVCSDGRIALCAGCEAKLQWVYEFVSTLNATTCRIRHKFGILNIQSNEIDEMKSQPSDIGSMADSKEIETTEISPTSHTNNNVSIEWKPRKATPVMESETTSKPSELSKCENEDAKPKRKRRSKGDREDKTVCKLCGKRYSSHSNMLRHYRAHIGVRYLCKYEGCGSMYTQRSSLQQHYIRHEGTTSFVCEICLKEFTQKKTLKIHRLIHTGEKPFTCDYCSSSFNQKANLIRHFVIHKKPMRPKPFQCTECEKRMSSKQNLFRHLNRHQRQLQLLLKTE